MDFDLKQLSLNDIERLAILQHPLLLKTRCGMYKVVRGTLYPGDYRIALKPKVSNWTFDPISPEAEVNEYREFKLRRVLDILNRPVYLYEEV